MKTKYFLNMGRSAAIVLGIGYALSASAANSRTFTDAMDIKLTNNSYSLTTADLMGNGKQDIIAGDGSVLINTSPGDGSVSFTPGPSVPAAQWVTTADINGDGKPDLIEANETNQVAVFINTTQPGDTVPSFAAPVYFNAGGAVSMVVATDVNGDNLPDLLAIDSDNNAVDVLINTTIPGDTNVTFSNFQGFQGGNNVNWIAAGDLNGDGMADIVAVNNIDNTISVYINTMAQGDTTPSFALQQVFTAGNVPNSVVIADINGDGNADVVIGNDGDSYISVLLNTTPNLSTTVSFAPEQTFATGSVPMAVVAADVDGDGRLDIIAGNNQDSTVSVLMNTTAAQSSTASFDTQEVFGVGVDPEDIVAADLNGDGKIDFAVMDSAGYAGWPSVTALINVPNN